MKEVLKVSVNGKFRQYLMKSEVRFINNICKDFGTITVELVEMTIERYKLEFGK